MPSIAAQGTFCGEGRRRWPLRQQCMSLGEFGVVAADLAEGRQWQYPNLGAPKSAD